jgi:hypothetical protein
MSKQRSFATLPMLAVAVVALLLGSVGTATAGTLTPRMVKKIAAKVVNQEAKKLSVAHAASADQATSAANSAQLGGKAPGAYLQQAYTVEIPAGTTGSSVLDLPAVPAGTYLVTMSQSVRMATSGGYVSCLLRNGTTPVLIGYGAADGLVDRDIEASGVVTVAPGMTLYCSGIASGNLTMPVPGMPQGRIVFSRIDTTTDLGSLTEP